MGRTSQIRDVYRGSRSSKVWFGSQIVNGRNVRVDVASTYGVFEFELELDNKHGVSDVYVRARRD